MLLKGEKDSTGSVEVTATLLRKYSFHTRAAQNTREAEESHFLDVEGKTCTYFHFIRDNEGKVTDGFQCRNGVATTRNDHHGWLCHSHKPRLRTREVPADAWSSYHVDPAFIIAQDAKGR